MNIHAKEAIKNLDLIEHVCILMYHLCEDGNNYSAVFEGCKRGELIDLCG